MGYTTDFNGKFNLDKPLTEKQFNYINAFSETRRMGRDIKVLMDTFKGENGLPDKEGGTAEEIYGKNGQFFIGDDSTGVINYNTPPGSAKYGSPFKPNKNGDNQPGLWCQWVVEGGDEQELVWDGGEKFNEYVEWLRYLIDNFFEPWGVKLNGEVEWVGEDSSDLGKMVVKDNVLEVYDGTVKYKKQ